MSTTGCVEAAAEAPGIFTYVAVLGLLTCSALFSGLNLGLMSLDIIGLEVVENCEDPVQRKYAKGLRGLRSKGNFLLCTLLLGNTLVNAVLATFLASIAGGLIGSLITTFAIVIFGEIIPQSVCSRHGLKVGYYTRFIVWFFMVITAVIAWPIAKILDEIMGEEIGATYSREQMMRLIEVHAADRHGTLESDELLYLTGALQFTQKTAVKVMTKIEKVFMLDVNERSFYLFLCFLYHMKMICSFICSCDNLMYVHVI